MHIALLSNEYPPYVYGGAGVHVAHLSSKLAQLENGANEVTVYCFGDQRKKTGNLSVQGIKPDCELPAEDPRHLKIFSPLLSNLIMAGKFEKADIIHAHTWYTALAGCLLKELYQIPLVLTTHSLEPQRPWKAEQLGEGGYRASTWLEAASYAKADGVIAVSEAMKRDVNEIFGVEKGRIRTIHNGIDTQQYRPIYNREVLHKYGINPQEPYILFVGRITRQKGLNHFINTLPYLQENIQAVICAASPDSEQFAEQVAQGIEKMRFQLQRPVVWISDPVPQEDLIPLYSQSAVFVCPSIYEPFGIINLEAMACGTPVVASSVGGIPEIVTNEQNGLLVSFEATSALDPEPKYPGLFAQNLAKAVERILQDPSLRERMSKKALEVASLKFSWEAIASRTLDFYRSLV